MRKWTVEEDHKDFPKNKLKIVYDKDDNVLFGSSMTKGKVMYKYIPGEFMENGNRYILSSSIKYDGKGNYDLPEDAEIIDYYDLHKTFIDNVFP